jgi:8-oxo-dGTP pyrophosphatase MutT (NUDIX family)
MQRELREETGITLPYAAWQIPLIEKNDSLFLLVVPTDRVLLLDGEHTEFRWIDPKDRHQYNPAPGVEPLIQRALTFARAS